MDFCSKKVDYCSDGVKKWKVGTKTIKFIRKQMPAGPMAKTVRLVIIGTAVKAPMSYQFLRALFRIDPEQ